MTWQWPFSNTISWKFICLKFSLLRFICFGIKYFVSSSKSREIGKSITDSRTRSKLPKRSTHISLFLKLTIFLWTQVYSFALKSTKPSDIWIWRSQRTRKYPKINSFRRSRKHFISLMSETWEYELFISINFLQHDIYKERPTRFEGELSKNLKEEFTVSVEDTICIKFSDKLVSLFRGGHLFYCRSRWYTTGRGHSFYCRSRRYII